MNYYEQYGISNSSLKYLNPEEGGSPLRFKNFLDGKNDKWESTSLERGTLLHSWVEDPDKFIVEDIDKPSSPYDKVAEYIATLDQTQNLDQAIIQKFRDDNFYKAWKDETILNKFKENCTEYLAFLAKKSDKIVMTKATKEIVDSCKQSILDHNFARNLLFNIERTDPNEEITYEDYDKFNELEFYWKYNGMPLKARIDRLLVKDNQAVLVDLKTTSYAKSLFKTGSFESYRYYRQMAFYVNAIKTNMSHITDIEVYMVVVETTKYYETLVVKLSEETLEKGYEEFTRLLELAKFCEVNGYKYFPEEFENKYIVI